MVIDKETFTEIAGHLEKMSEYLLKSAIVLSRLEIHDESDNALVLVEALASANNELLEVTNRLKAVHEENGTKPNLAH